MGTMTTVGRRMVAAVLERSTPNMLVMWRVLTLMAHKISLRWWLFSLALHGHIVTS